MTATSAAGSRGQLGVILKLAHIPLNVSCFGNCAIHPMIGGVEGEKLLHLGCVCVCKTECMREIRAVEKIIRDTIYFLCSSSVFE